MRTKLVEINLTGVQNFLAQAKQTKDLCNGSAMVKKEILWIKENCENYFKAGVEFLLWPEEGMDGTNELRMLVQTDICDDKKLEDGLGSYLKAEAQKQADIISADMGVYIASSEYTGDYDKDFLRLQRRLLCKKNNRMQELILTEADNEQSYTRRKCVMCGIRPAADTLDTKDGICPECSKKRNYNKTHFPSTLDLARDNRGFYSLIQMDVDDLGKRMAKTEDSYGGNLFQWQRDISDRLGELAKAVNDIMVLKDKGRLIYKGGDDFLMFCPLKELWELLQCFDENFEKLVNAAGDEKASFTYSVNITIAHEKIPLRRVVGATRNGLERVKNAYEGRGKGGIHFILLERSSGEHSCMLSGDKPMLYKELCFITDGLKKGGMPRSAIYELEDALSGIGRAPAAVDDYRDLQQIIFNEVVRIVSRKHGGENYAVPMKKLIGRFWDSSSGCVLVNDFTDLLFILDRWGRCMKEEGNAQMV